MVQLIDLAEVQRSDSADYGGSVNYMVHSNKGGSADDMIQVTSVA